MLSILRYSFTRHLSVDFVRKASTFDDNVTHLFHLTNIYPISNISKLGIHETSSLLFEIDISLTLCLVGMCELNVEAFKVCTVAYLFDVSLYTVYYV